MFISGRSGDGWDMSEQEFENRIIGVIRFSFPSLNAFKKSPTETGDLLKFLYDPERLERRFRWFERLCLPSMAAQTDKDFQLAVVTGTALPKPYRQRLDDLVATVPQAFVVALDPTYNYFATRAAAHSCDLEGATHMTSFRLDDDDALDMNFVARLRGQASILSNLNPAAHVAISQNRGFFLEQGTKVYDVLELTPPGSGPALMAPVEDNIMVYVQNHRLLSQMFNTYSDAEVPSFIRSVHRDNDSNPHKSGRKDILSPEEVSELIPKHFPFTLKELLEI